MVFGTHPCRRHCATDTVSMLSPLWPTRLVTQVQLTCKLMAIAAESDCLWRNIYHRLSKTLRDRTDATMPPLSGANDTTKIPHHKELFLRALAATLESRSARAARKIERGRRRLGVIHGLRGSVDALKAGLTVRLSGSPVSVVDTIGTRTEGWVSRANILSEPAVRDGMRTFSLSSSIKIDMPATMTAVSQLRSMHVSLSTPDAWLAGATLLKIDLPVLTQRLLLDASPDKSIACYEISSETGDAEKLVGEAVGPPLPRACALLGVLGDVQTEKNQGDSGIGFLSVHLPHQLLLDAATRRVTPENTVARRSQAYHDDSAGAAHGLENYSAALGLRTAAVALWEASAVGMTGRLCPQRLNVSRKNQRSSKSVLGGLSGANQNVVCMELVGLGDNIAFAERTLSACPGIPFTTSGGLSGVLENVLLTDFALWDAHGDSLWAFTFPMTLEPSPPAVDGGDDVLDMQYGELRGRRLRGVVEEPGIGRVTVELTLASQSGEEGEVECSLSSRKLRRRQSPAGYTWVVRLARVELELGFVNVWFGTTHRGDEA